MERTRLRDLGARALSPLASVGGLCCVAYVGNMADCDYPDCRDEATEGTMCLHHALAEGRSLSPAVPLLSMKYEDCGGDMDGGIFNHRCPD
jgi:hypothetical protein